MPLHQGHKLNQDIESDLSDSDLEMRNSCPREQILVIDDTSANLKLVSDFLIEAGFRVQAAKSGIQALKLLERASPDLILLDVMMPEMDGFETCRRLKDWEKTRDIPVIFMTAVVDSSEPTYKVKGLTLGAVDYISKPIQLEEVLARVKTHLHLRSLTQQLQAQNARLSEEIEVRRHTEDQLRLLERAIAASSNGIIISDPHQPNNPVIYANSGFERITGYKPEEVIGKNCRFLQGTDTNQPALDELHRSIDEGRETQVILRNYRKDGTLFWNEFCLSPVRDATGRLTNFIGVQTDITERQRREDALRLIVEGTAATTGEEFFRCCTRYLAQVLQVRYAFLTQRIKGSTTKVRTLAFWTGEEFGENFEYEVAGTPCEPVFLGASVHYPEDVQARFPDDECLVDFGIQGFLGMPLISTAGDILGYLAVMHTSRLDNDPDKALILRIFAARAGAELERQRAEDEIRFLLSATQAIAGAENFNSALSLMLHSCCDYINWDFGEAWIPNKDETHLEYFQSTYTQFLHHPPNPPYQGGNKNQTNCPLNQEGNKNQTNCPLNQEGNKNQMNCPLNQGGNKNQMNSPQGGRGGQEEVRGVHQDSDAGYERTNNNPKSQLPNPKLLDPALEEFSRESRSVTFAPGAGLPGRIWSSQQPEWLEDFSLDPSQLFRRHAMAAAVGLKAGFGIPILVNDQVLAILVFFKRQATPLQPHLVEVIQAVATQVASLIGRKRVEEQLRKSEERWQLALNGNNDGVWDWNINTNETFRSARFMEILGYEDHEMGTSNDEWVNHIHPDDVERVMKVNQDYLERKTPYYAIEHRLRCKDGTYKWVLSRGQAQWDEARKPIRMVGSTSDITPRKIAEAKLRASEARLAEAQRVAHVGNWEFDLLTQKIIWSEEMFHIFGLNPTHPELTLDEHIQQVLPEDRVLWRKTVARALKSGTSYKLDFRILRPDRQIRYIEARGKAVVNEQGQVIKLFGTALDITERKQIEAEIIRSKDLLASIFNESADALFLANPETGLITDCNQRAVQLFEVNTKDELLNIEGQTLQKEQFKPEDLSSMGDELDRKGIWSRELEYVTKTGKLFWGSLAVKPIQVAGETINLVRVSDITDRKQAEVALRQSEARERERATQLHLTLQELKRTQAQLIQAEKMSSLGRMIAGVAHEINNPVSFIHGNLTPAREYFKDVISLIELYQQAYPNPTREIQQLIEEIDLEFLIEDWQKLIHSMQVGTERIEQIVLSLKTFSRLDEADLKQVNIHEGIENTLLILHHRLRAAGNAGEIQVVKNYSQLPLVACYASQLNQVVMNLLDNAIDALENQPEPRVITITTSSCICQLPATSDQLSVGEQIQQTTNNEQQTTNFVVIRIADNGLGMSEEVRQQMFDPFYTTKPVGSGTGLGLAICHQIVVEKHQGRISCRSTPGQGTEVIVEIPVNRQAHRVGGVEAHLF